MREIFSQVSSRPGAVIVEVYWYQSHQYLFFLISILLLQLQIALSLHMLSDPSLHSFPGTAK